MQNKKLGNLTPFPGLYLQKQKKYTQKIEKFGAFFAALFMFFALFGNSMYAELPKTL